jgi:hypothetical protein
VRNKTEQIGRANGIVQGLALHVRTALPVHSVLAAAILFISCASIAHADSPRILYIGDSHTVGTFGRTLDAHLRQIEGAVVATYGICSSSPEWFFTGQSTHCGAFLRPESGKERRLQSAPSPDVIKLLDRLHPETTIVALGANQLRGTVEDARKQIHHLISEIHAHQSRCIWVGPPDERFVSKKAQGKFYEMLSSISVSLDCPLIDSRRFTQYPPKGGDGIHYDSLGPKGSAQAKAWGEQVATAIQAMLTQ